MKFLKRSGIRTLTASLFLIGTVTGLAFTTGWGTLSSFGYQEIAAVCPLGSLETMLASKEFLPHAFIGLAIFALLAFVFGRFFCGWMCPVPLIRKIFGLKDQSSKQSSQSTDKKAACGACNVCRSGSQNPSTESETAKNATPQSKKLSSASPSQASRESTVSESVEPIEHNLKKEADEAIGQSESSDQNDSSEKSRTQISRTQGSASVEATPFIVLGGTLAGCAVFGFPIFCLICPVGLTFAVIIGLWRVFEFQEFSLSLPLFVLFLFLEIVVLRKWCHKFCPLGALFSVFALFNRTFRPQINRSACMNVSNAIPCQKCHNVCPEGIDLKEAPNSLTMSRCTRCGKCADACSLQAVKFYPSPAAGQTQPLEPKWPQPVLKTKVPVAERLASFKEIYRPFTQEEALKESSRCVNCGLCSQACPQHNPIPQWIGALAAKDFKTAQNLVLRAGSLPEICSRVCPQENLCERACPLGTENGAIAIGMLSRFVSDRALKGGRWRPVVTRSREKTGQAAIIGAGPAGLAAADVLARKGWKVRVFDSAPLIGGFLSFGIPPFKLDKDNIVRRRKILEKEGVRFTLNSKLGTDIDLKALVEDNDAVLIATGASEPREPDFLKSDGRRVYNSVDFLNALNKTLLNLGQFDLSIFRNKTVLVLGGGDTAMDCLRCASRLGAKAICAYRGTEAKMKATFSEKQNALEEGAEIRYELTPIALRASDDGLVVDFKTPGDETVSLVSDYIITAFGLQPHHNEALDALGIACDEKGRIIIPDPNHPNRTAHPKVFAAGDAVTGPALVVTAARSGKAAALSIVEQTLRTRQPQTKGKPACQLKSAN